jgi:hypothetical protein
MDLKHRPFGRDAHPILARLYLRQRSGPVMLPESVSRPLLVVQDAAKAAFDHPLSALIA